MRLPLPLPACIALAVLLTAFSAARADELKLKDGTTIVGTIVGFEENSFKVKTNYGFAEVQKDQVVSIVVSAAPKKKESGEKTRARDASRIRVNGKRSSQTIKTASPGCSHECGAVTGYKQFGCTAPDCCGGQHKLRESKSSAGDSPGTTKTRTHARGSQRHELRE